MDENFWHRRWEKNEIGFHKTEPHHYLLRFVDRLRVKKGDTVFLPLCGKSPDLMWLREQGLNVVGVELSRIAVDDFFAENGLEGRWTTVAGMPCCCAEDLTIFCGDFFKLSADLLGGARIFYDRAALVALPPEMRGRYADHIASLLPAGGRMLLIGYEYDQNETYGPPFAVLQPEVDALFGRDFFVELLLEEDTLWLHQGLAARGVTQLTEYVVLLTRR